VVKNIFFLGRKKQAMPQNGGRYRKMNVLAFWGYFASRYATCRGKTLYHLKILWNFELKIKPHFQPNALIHIITK